MSGQQLYLGDKARELLEAMAKEANIKPKYFLTKLLLYQARARAVVLTADKLQERLKLIEEVDDELTDYVNRETWQPLNTLTDERAVYKKIWMMRKRLEQRGMTDKQIHDFCMRRYGRDFKIAKTPEKGRRIKVE